VTSAIPVPEAPLVIVTHEAPLVAVQAQVEPDVVTVRDPLAPAAATDWLVEDRA